MPSSKNKHYDDYYDEEPDEYYETTNRWCTECQSQEILMNGLCECCNTLKRVARYGEVSFDNEYWMNSPCDTGIRLRKSWSVLNLEDPVYQEEELPFPVYLNTPQETTELLVLNPTKEESLPGSAKTNFTWATPQEFPLEDFKPVTRDNQGKTAYVPPHKRGAQII